MRAMVIDDSSAMRMILRRIMTQAGFTTTEAADGQQALDLPRDRRRGTGMFALVDWNMPNMNGLEFVKAVRVQERLLPNDRHDGHHRGRAVPNRAGPRGRCPRVCHQTIHTPTPSSRS